MGRVEPSVLVTRNCQVHSKSHGKPVPFQVQGGWSERLCCPVPSLSVPSSHGSLNALEGGQVALPVVSVEKVTGSYSRERLSGSLQWDRRNLASDGKCS